jgi:hypothetical protein
MTTSACCAAACGGRCAGDPGHEQGRPGGQVRTLLPSLESWRRGDFAALVPVSALRAKNLEHARDGGVAADCREGPFLFEEDEITDRSARFLVAEIVREKLTRQLGDELPYAATVEIEEFGEEGCRAYRRADPRRARRARSASSSAAGSRLRSIGTEARQDLERLLDQKVMLRLWVKVRSGWADDERALRSLGYDDGPERAPRVAVGGAANSCNPPTCCTADPSATAASCSSVQPRPGRLGLVARGVNRRRRGGSLAALLQPFGPCC